jgi:hypothetical protein
LVLGVATFGLYNIWKATRQARKTVQKTGVAIEGFTDDIETSAAALGATVVRVADDLSLFVGELENLMVARRAFPRSETDLRDTEVERLRALRAVETELLDELAERGVDAEAAGARSDISGAAVPGNKAELQETVRLLSRLAIVRSAIDEVLYAEPGVVPACLYDIEEALKRFNTLEQTGIEDLIATTRSTFEESEAVLKEIEHLLVVRTYKPVDVAALSAEEREELARLRSSVDLYDRLIGKNAKTLIRLQEELLHAHLEEWSGFPGAPPSGREGWHADEVKRSDMLLPCVAKTAGAGLPLRNPVQSMPEGARIAGSLHRTDISALLGNHAALLGVNRYYERERLMAEKRIASLTRVPCEEPGVIPGTLEEMGAAIARFRVEGQPRLELLLDNLNLALTESRSTTSRIDRILAAAEAVSDYVLHHSLLFKIGAVVLVGLVSAILVFILIWLVRVVLVI